MLKNLMIVTIFALGSVSVLAQKPKPRPKPKRTIYVVGDPMSHSCVESPTPGKPSSKPISGGILNGKAMSLPEPALPQTPSDGVINVQVLIDEEGNVAAASATTTSAPLPLRAAAVAAARKAKFYQTRMSGRPVKVAGILTYDFTAIRKAKLRTPGPGNAARSKNVSKVISGGVMNGKATNLPKPAYPVAALAVRVEGVVGVQVLIDEEGKVISASAASGHPLLRGAAVNAAKEATFEPMSLGGEPIRITGFITYIFSSDLNWGQAGRFLSQAEAGQGHKEMLQVIASKLPGEFREEKIEIGSLSFLATGTYAKPGELTERAKRVIESIQEKLLNDPVSLWQFSFKVTLGRIKGNINDDSSLAMHLLRLRELISSAPDGIGGGITREIRAIADHAGKFAFTGAERENILLAVK